MLAFPASLKIYLAIEPVDMRKQFDGLWAVAQQKLRVDPSNGALFVFVNKRRNLLAYLKKTDVERYNALIQKLGLRK